MPLISAPQSPYPRWLRRTLVVLICVVTVGCSFWAAAALYFDFPVERLRIPLAVLLIAIAAAISWLFRARVLSLAFALAPFGLVLGWWFSLQPSNNRPWQADVAQLPWAEVSGDFAVLHNIRNCTYQTEKLYTCQWETKMVDVAQIESVDLFLTHWGAPLIAHAIVSFQFHDGTYLAMSIEARKTIGQEYSAIRGFFRQYNLIYLVAEERDVVRVRTNYRQGEDVRLYHTRTRPNDARRLFLQYLYWMNAVAVRPEWYNALTANCTSSVTRFLAASKIGGLSAWDWRTVLNGHGDRMLYDLGDLSTGGLSFDELSKQALINPSAKQMGNPPDFSRRIRLGRVGFTNLPAAPTPSRQ